MLMGVLSSGSNFNFNFLRIIILTRLVNCNNNCISILLAIHRAAGPELREACYKVPEVRAGVRCPTGEARITPYVMPAISSLISRSSAPSTLKYLFRN